MAMYKSLKTVLIANQPIWSSLTAFGSAVQSFTQRLDALEQSGYEQNLALVGVSAAKEAKKAIVLEKAFAISSALSAFAVVTNNVELISHMKIAKSKLEVASRSNVLVLVDRIIARATDYVGQLDAYGVDQASIDELLILRAELNVQMNAPRNAIIERKGKTQRIQTLTSEIDAIIRLQLDKLVVVLKNDFPDFYMNYTDARIIIESHHRTTDSQGNTGSPPPSLNP